VAVLAAEAAETPAGEWVVGFGHDDTKLDEGRHPTRHDLDRVSEDHPVYVTPAGGHVSMVNTRGLELAGVDADTPDPDGGHFEREEDGYPNGVLHEAAQRRFGGGDDHEGLIPDPTPEEDQGALAAVCERYNAEGITSVGEAVVGPDEIRMYRDGVKEDNLSVRAYLMVLHDHFEKLRALEVDSGFGDEMVQVGLVKNFVDGAIAARTAYLEEPYDGRDDRGDLVISQEELNEQVMEAHEAGYQIGVHANGDAAIEMLLEAYERALEAHPREHRHRIEHATMVTDDILDRIEALDLCVLPFSTYIYQHGDDKLGEYGDRLERMFPYASYVERGLTVGSGSDHPAGLLPPLLGIRTMVTRKTRSGDRISPHEAIGVEEAIRVYTSWAARCSFEEDVKGSIEPGKLADFVILDADPTAVDPDDIHEIGVEATYLGGERVHSAE
jgi:predicted amidohydrolase YtcJ